MKVRSEEMEVIFILEIGNYIELNQSCDIDREDRLKADAETFSGHMKTMEETNDT